MAKIRITGNKKNKIRGFGILRRNYPCDLIGQDEYVVPDKAINYLLDFEIKFVMLP